MISLRSDNARDYNNVNVIGVVMAQQNVCVVEQS